MEDILENRHDIVLSHECFVELIGSRHILKAPFFFLVRTSWLTHGVGFLTGSMTPNLVSLFNSSLRFSRTATCILLLGITAGTASGLSCSVVTPDSFPSCLSKHFSVVLLYVNWCDAVEILLFYLH